jgi:ectoine hydroxylase-related dioxygenase (phytanoyl-CoA dioxygenase family)
MKKDVFLKNFEKNGFVVVENVFSEEFLDSILPELEVAKQKEAKINKQFEKDFDGTLLACPVYGGKFLEVLENQNYIMPFNWLLGESCIIWVYTSSCIAPNSVNGTSRIHVDRPHFTFDFKEGVGSLILLDDFTEENGATWFLPGSHSMQNMPDNDFFYKNAKRLVAPKGSVFYFNLRLWHAGGENKTNTWRNSLGIGMIRPYIKQRIDLPRAMNPADIDKLSDALKQKLGFFAQPPTSLEEFHKNGLTQLKLQPSEWKY